jgi:hypothetical protein
MQKRILCYAVALLFSSFLPSQEVTAVYSADKPIWDLRLENATDMTANDDGTSQAFNLGFDFTFFGETFDQAYMASNGCLIFGALATGNNWEKNCTQYNPSPEPNTNYTMYPFWTDLIMRDNSDMLAKQFNDKVIFGWYEMWEYDRDSKNTFELWLYPNDSYEARYGELDIKEHDVFIGIQGSSKEFQTYYFHDECNTGVVNSSTCVNQSWNDSTKNSELEYGGSLLVGEATDCSNPLNNTSCAGYWDAYDDQQCDLDPQYGPFCRGYTQEDSVAYFDEEQVDYGFNEEDLWYDEEFDEWLDPNDPCYQNNCADFTDADWYALDTEQFGQEQVDEWFGSDISFNDDGMVNFETTRVESYDDVDVMMDVWDLEQEQYRQEEALLEEFLFQESFLVEDYSEPDTFIEFETIEQLEEWFEEETTMEEELANLEAPEEEFIEEIFEEDEVEEIFEDIEDRMAEAEIEEQLEREEAPQEFEENFVEEFQITEREEATGKSSITRELALSVISSAVTTAQNSISGTTAGSFADVTNSSSSDTSANSSANSGISTSNSPSMSDQIASASVQTNQLLDMSSTSVSDSSFDSVSIEAETSVGDLVSVDLAVETTQDQIDASVETTGTDSETDATVASIVAENLQLAQDQATEQQEETGKYGSENAIIAVMGFVPDFNSYRLVSILPEKEFWYEPKSIYTNNGLSDNTEAFYGLVGESIRTLTDLKNLQPTL